MSRYRGPRIRIVRRLGTLPGLTTKKTKRETLPGQHRKNRKSRNRISSYAIRLQEKQKLRFNYGITENQLLTYVKKSKRLKGATCSVLLQLLEMRLDNIIFRLGFGNTIPASRQLVNHGHILVNGKKVTIPSFQCHPNDTIEVRNNLHSQKLVRRFLKSKIDNSVPSFLDFKYENLTGNVKRIALRTEANIRINELLIVEYYSRK